VVDVIVSMPEARWSIWIFAICAILTVSVPSTVRGDFKSGEDAYFKGHYDIAYIQLLAEAKSGNGTAQYYLGQMYRMGRGIQLDLPEAYGWYSAAYESGLNIARSKISELRPLFDMGMSTRFSLGDKVRASRLAREYALQYSRKPENFSINTGPDGAGLRKCIDSSGNQSYEDQPCEQGAFQQMVEVYDPVAKAEFADEKEPCTSPLCIQQARDEWNRTMALWKKGDYASALPAITDAAKKGRALAQGLVGESYKLGLGIAQDHVQAYAWFDLAASQGLKWASSKRDELAKNLTAAQISQAKELTKEWTDDRNTE
jgi:TPR repeat protein